ncbi:MAG: DEAD/DEAH box helicase [Bacteroidia bacterium]
MTFSDLNFEPELTEGLLSMGFEKPTPIQQQAIPIIMNNHDLIACAQTGTGKTAAYLLPIINKIIQSGTTEIHTLVIVPTRELAIQIDEALQGLSYFASVSSIAIFGGNDGYSFEQEKRALTQGANIVIATPGRLISHFAQGYVKISKLQNLVLDEADRMLDMGFSDDINKIIGYLPQLRQTLLFSATMPHKIRALAKKIMKDPEQINIAVSKPAEGVEQGAYIVHNAQKIELLKELLVNKNYTSILIFASTKEKVKQLEKELLKLKFNAAAIHSDLEQATRNEVLRQFKNKKLQTLVATDILSRGIDIDSIGLVINYDVPGDAEDYIHRVGRTARAESTGHAITFVNEDDQRKFKKIEEFMGSEVTKLKVPEALGATPAFEPEKHAGRSRGGSFGGKRKPFRKKSYAKG